MDNPRCLDVIGLAVADVSRAVAFYVGGLGWRVIADEAPEMAYLTDGHTVLALSRADVMTRYLGTGDPPIGAPGVSTTASFTRQAASAAQVDAIWSAARVAGAKALRPLHDTAFGARAVIFTDPDGHVWEVIFNPRRLWLSTRATP